jgi:hypothetical protein
MLDGLARETLLTQPTISALLLTLKRFRGLMPRPYGLGFSQDGSSEEFIGEWAEKRGIRDQLVIATKVCARSVAAFSPSIIVTLTHSSSIR